MSKKLNLLSMCIPVVMVLLQNQVSAQVTVTGDVRPTDPSTWTTNTNVRAGDGATGTIDVRGGITVQIKETILGTSPGGNIGTGTLTVSGADTVYAHQHNLVVGQSGRGELDVNDGAVVTAANFAVGLNSLGFGNGTVNLSGIGSLIRVGKTGIGGFSFPGGGTGVVNVGVGSTLSVLGPIDIWKNGTLNVAGGTIETHGFGINLREPGAKVNFTAGKISSNISGSLSVSGGTLSSSLITGTLTQGGGTLAPGNSPGETTIEGDYVLNSGSIDIEVAGLDAGTTFDFVDVQGTMSIDPNDTFLNVSFLDGFENSILGTDTFTILTADGGLSGSFRGLADGATFATADGAGTFRINYTDDSIILSNYVSAVPEPNSAMVMLLGLMGYGLKRRHRMED